jgi:hypothetical protein
MSKEPAKQVNHIKSDMHWDDDILSTDISTLQGKDRVPDSWEDERTRPSCSTYENATFNASQNPLDSQLGFQPKIKILKRDPSKATESTKSTASSSQANPVLSLEEKQKRYEEAKRRIFSQKDGFHDEA